MDPAAYVFHSISCLNGRYCVLVGEAMVNGEPEGVAYITTDGGRAWNRAALPRPPRTGRALSL